MKSSKNKLQEINVILRIQKQETSHYTKYPLHVLYCYGSANLLQQKYHNMDKTHHKDNIPL